MSMKTIKQYQTLIAVAAIVLIVAYIYTNPTILGGTTYSNTIINPTPQPTYNYQATPIPTPYVPSSTATPAPAPTIPAYPSGNIEIAQSGEPIYLGEWYIYYIQSDFANWRHHTYAKEYGSTTWEIKDGGTTLGDGTRQGGWILNLGDEGIKWTVLTVIDPFDADGANLPTTSTLSDTEMQSLLNSHTLMGSNYIMTPTVQMYS